MCALEKYFNYFRQNIVGIDAQIDTPLGKKPLIYADWIASGRMYKPIEDLIESKFLPYVGNTHSEASYVGMFMTNAYEYARHIIKKHVNASEDDVFIPVDSGMTRAINKFIRILGFKFPDPNSFFFHETKTNFPTFEDLGDNRPVIFISHFEHHSHQLTWLETFADVVIIPPNNDLSFSIENFKTELEKYQNRKIKIGAFSAGSNVTGIFSPIKQIAKLLHQHNGYCFVDYAGAAPYVKIDMHPADEPLAYLDAIYFSPHKFLGGPGSVGVLIFNKKFYYNLSPDHPGGGTVRWTNPWGGRRYINDIEIREDGGTPPFIQTIRAALAIKLKEKMGIDNILQREKELLSLAFEKLSKIDCIHILAPNIKERLGVISFYCDHIHHNLIVKILNDYFGIQVRGGCSCAGTYGHYLFKIDQNKSKFFTDLIDSGDSTLKPGWVRISLHPTMTNEELLYIIDAITQITLQPEKFSKNYVQIKETGEWYHLQTSNNIDFDDIFSNF